MVDAWLPIEVWWLFSECLTSAQLSIAWTPEFFLRRLDLSFGIRESALAWIRSYLDNRTQRVRYNGFISESTTVFCGVPQGSVLGPLYFLCYTSDVSDIVLRHGFRIHEYADDLQLYQHCLPSDMQDLNSGFTSCMDAIQCWMSSSRLKLNASKTEVLWLGSPRRLINLTPPPVVLGGVGIQLSDEVRSLGVVIGVVTVRHIRKSRLKGGSDVLLSPSSAAFHSKIAHSRFLPCAGPSPGNQPIGLLQWTSWWIAQEPDRAAGQCPQSICSTRSPAATTGPHHRRDEGKTSLVGRVGPDKIQILCVRVSLRKRHRSTISIETMRSGLHNVGTVKAALGGHRWTLGPFLQQTIGPRAFAVSCPSAWNSLSIELRLPGLSLSTFKRHLKTELFRSMLLSWQTARYDDMIDDMFCYNSF